MRTVEEYFFTFMIYSIGGWIAETLLYIIRDKKAVKRGFLFGPVCPIYGTGAVICTALLYGRITNIILLFLIGALLCGTIEYITHFLMEKLFNAMWWDYSNRRFNIKGRVYLKGLVFFGIGVVVIIKLLQPAVYGLLAHIGDGILDVICLVMYTVFIIDITATVADLKKFISSLKNIQAFLIEKGQMSIDKTGNAINCRVDEIKSNEIFVRVAQKLKSSNPIAVRIKEKYPNFTLKKYKAIYDIIMDTPQEGKERKDLKLYGTADSVPQSDEQSEKTSSL